jgi:MraZ protein
MFQGQFEHTLDDKNRVVLPVGLRKGLTGEQLQEGFTLGIGRRATCLELQPTRDWREWAAKQRSLYDESDDEAYEYLLDIFSSATEITLDAQYRFVLPEGKKKDAGIETEIVFVGRDKVIQIWDRKRWEERKKERAGKQAPPPRRSVAGTETPPR